MCVWGRVSMCVSCACACVHVSVHVHVCAAGRAARHGDGVQRGARCGGVHNAAGPRARRGGAQGAAKHEECVGMHGSAGGAHCGLVGSIIVIDRRLG